jgi:2-dehydropantoate 2-reductase
MNDLLIVGSGAMALLFGARLAAAGENLTFLGTWQDGLEAIKFKGIEVVSEDEEIYQVSRVVDKPGEITDCRLALVLVKSWQTERAAKQLLEILSPDGLALTLQNGVGNLQILTKHLGPERTAQGVTTYGATLLGPGKVRPAGEGLISLQEHPRLPEMIEILRRSGLAVQQVPDLTSLIWGKLIINVAINPLTALLEIRNGRLLESEATRIMMGKAAREAAEVAKKMGINIEFSDPSQAAEAVAFATSENKSSMYQDIDRGAPTEIDVLCGVVSKEGENHQVPTPVNDLFWSLIKAKVDLRKNQSENNQNIS